MGLGLCHYFPPEAGVLTRDVPTPRLVTNVTQVRFCLQFETTVSRRVGGILSRANPVVTIHLCGLPEGAVLPRRTGRPSLCSTLLPEGFTSRPGHPGRWCALTAPFHPCLWHPANRLPIGGLLSVARPSGRPDLVLTSSVPCGVPTFLSAPVSPPMAAVTRTTHRRPQSTCVGLLIRPG